MIKWEKAMTEITDHIQKKSEQRKYLVFFLYSDISQTILDTSNSKISGEESVRIQSTTNIQGVHDSVKCTELK